MSSRLQLIIVFFGILLLATDNLKAQEFGYSPATVQTKDGKKIDVYLELAISYGPKVNYKLQKDGKVMTIKASEVQFLRTPDKYIENISVNGEERLMARVVEGKVELFNQVHLSKATPVFDRNVEATYSAPTVIYVVKKGGEAYDVPKQDFVNVLSAVLSGNEFVTAKLKNNAYKYDDMERIITEFNAPEPVISAKRQITVKLVDAGTRKPVKGAKVQILGMDSATYSNVLGFFKLSVESSDILMIESPEYGTSQVLIPEANSFQIGLERKAQEPPNEWQFDLREFYEFIQTRVKYPAQARRMGVEGAVVARFTIDSTGHLLQIAKEKSISKECDEEVVRVIALAPPAMMSALFSQTRQTTYLLPVTFGLDEPYKSLRLEPHGGIMLLREVPVIAIGIERTKSEMVGMTDFNYRSLDDALKAKKPVKRLALAAQGLEPIPENVFGFAQLEFLDLEGNGIHSIPKAIGDLGKLQELHLSKNTLSALPEEIANLSKLNVLGLASNNFQQFPAEILAMKALEALDVSNNGLSSLPPEIGRMVNLRVLIIQNNKLTTLPPEMKKLRRLTNVYLEGNPINPADREKIEKLFSMAKVHW